VGDHYCHWAAHLMDILCTNGREAGMPLVNLAAAYRLTGDEKYVRAADAVIDRFVAASLETHGSFRYPEPFGSGPGGHHRYITGYGDWSLFAGMFRLWELTGAARTRDLLVAVLRQEIRPGRFHGNDVRTLDFFAAWMLAELTGDVEDTLARVQQAVPFLLRRGGHPLRRLHFLRMLDERGLLDDRDAGNRPTVI
jgi:hypothetical protein